MKMIMTRLALVSALAASAVLAGCATAPLARRAADAPTAAAAVEPDASPYGLFLAGQAAVEHGDPGSGAMFFGRAAAETDSDSGLLSERAFTAALLAGDLDRAARLAPRAGTGDGPLRHWGVLVRAVDALSRGDGRAAKGLLSGPDGQFSGEAAAALLLPFAAAQAGDVPGSVVVPVIAGDPISQYFANLDQARLLERARRDVEAEAAYRGLIGKGDPGGIASLALGEMLERRGRSADAVKIYDAALARGSVLSTIAGARTRAAAKGAPPREMTIRQAAAEALVAPATAMEARKQAEVALPYLRLALKLDPELGDARVMLGDLLTAMGDQAGARAAYAQVPANSPAYAGAREKLAWAAQTAGEKDEALRIARDNAAANPKDVDAAVTLADLLRADEQYAASARILDGLIAQQGDKADWRLLYMRAVDEQEMDRWPDAERDVQAALKLKPDEPELLNFLGFSWIDRGEKIPAALAMVQKAVDMDPNSGAMLDSLGWGYYRLGSYDLAVQKLESAVTLEPGDPDINDHLGDAYWRVGRRTEAEFQWRRVLTLAPTAKLKAAVEAKLSRGLGQTPPVKVAGS